MKECQILINIKMEIEIYESIEGYTAIDKEHQQKQLIIEPNSKLIKTIEGVDWNDCMKKYHDYMGWEPYKPI